MSPDRIVSSWSLNMFGSNELKLMVAQKVALFNAYVQSLGYDGDVFATDNYDFPGSTSYHKNIS